MIGAGTYRLAVVGFELCLGWEDWLRPCAWAGGRDYRGADVVFVAIGPVLGGEARALDQQRASPCQ